MSRTNPNPARPFWLEAYYGPGGRKATKGNPNGGRVGEREDDLAIAVEYASEDMCEMERRTLEDREDIGAINLGRNP